MRCAVLIASLLAATVAVPTPDPDDKAVYDLTKDITNELKSQLVEMKNAAEEARESAAAAKREREKASTIRRDIETKLQEHVEMARVAALKSEAVMNALQTDIDLARSSAEKALVSSATIALQELHKEAAKDQEEATAQLHSSLRQEESKYESNFDDTVKNIAHTILSQFQNTMQNQTLDAIVNVDTETNRLRAEAAALATRASVFAMRATQEEDKARETKKHMEVAMHHMAEAAMMHASAAAAAN